jgi:hypothetical protein
MAAPRRRADPYCSVREYALTLVLTAALLIAVVVL